LEECYEKVRKEQNNSKQDYLKGKFIRHGRNGYLPPVVVVTGEGPGVKKGKKLSTRVDSNPNG
jgi:hypothetical protein